MTEFIARPTAFALACLTLAACGETTTEPPPAAEPAPSSAAPAVASNSWITRADMPTERWGLTSAVVRNAAGHSILYAIGGSSASFPQPSGPTTGALTKVQAYDATTNDWFIRAPLPLPLYKSNGTGVIDGKIYISGGRMSGDKNYVQALFVYDPTTNTWTRKRDMPTESWGGMTAVIDNQLYVLTCVSEEDCWEFSTPLLYRYDPATDQWTFLSVAPVGLGFPMGGVIGGKLYATGGVNGNLLVYDPATNGWTSKAPLPGGRFRGAGVALGGKLYIIGGYQRNADGTRRLVRKTSVYDPATNTWTNKALMPSARFDFTAGRVVVGGQPRIELVGGARPGNNVQYVP
jgi:N-acetylneuraminic acid mutarotase